MVEPFPCCLWMCSREWLTSRTEIRNEPHSTKGPPVCASAAFLPPGMDCAARGFARVPAGPLHGIEGTCLASPESRGRLRGPSSGGPRQRRIGQGRTLSNRRPAAMGSRRGSNPGDGRARACVARGIPCVAVARTFAWRGANRGFQAAGHLGKAPREGTLGQFFQGSSENRFEKCFD